MLPSRSDKGSVVEKRHYFCDIFYPVSSHHNYTANSTITWSLKHINLSPSLPDTSSMTHQPSILWSAYTSAMTLLNHPILDPPVLHHSLFYVPHPLPSHLFHSSTLKPLIVLLFHSILIYLPFRKHFLQLDLLHSHTHYLYSFLSPFLLKLPVDEYKWRRCWCCKTLRHPYLRKGQGNLLWWQLKCIEPTTHYKKLR